MREIIILIDNAEQRNMHITEVLSKYGIKFKVVNLDFCDYTFQCDGKDFRNICSVERKATLSELAGNTGAGHKRFDKEFVRGIEAGCKMTLLIEDIAGREKMQFRRLKDANPLLTLDERVEGTWRSNTHANSMIGTIGAFKERYTLDVIFCRKNETADKLIEIFSKVVEEYYNNAIDTTHEGQQGALNSRKVKLYY